MNYQYAFCGAACLVMFCAGTSVLAAPSGSAAISVVYNAERHSCLNEATGTLARWPRSSSLSQSTARDCGNYRSREFVCSEENPPPCAFALNGVSLRGADLRHLWIDSGVRVYGRNSNFEAADMRGADLERLFLKHNEQDMWGDANLRLTADDVGGRFQFAVFDSLTVLPMQFGTSEQDRCVFALSIGMRFTGRNLEQQAEVDSTQEPAQKCVKILGFRAATREAEARENAAAVADAERMLRVSPAGPRRTPRPAASDAGAKTIPNVCSSPNPPPPCVAPPAPPPAPRPPACNPQIASCPEASSTEAH